VAGREAAGQVAVGTPAVGVGGIGGEGMLRSGEGVVVDYVVIYVDSELRRKGEEAWRSG